MKTVHWVPHFHYDFVWVRKADHYARVTVDNIKKALEHMRKHPNYTFVLDQIPEFEAFKITYPELWAELKQRIKERRLSLANGMYISPDIHLPNGESLVRQIIYGKKFIRENFGVEFEPKVAYNLDVFGQTGQYPQILKKGEYNSYIFWRGVNRELPSEFLWEGVDGTRIFTHWLAHSYTFITLPGYEVTVLPDVVHLGFPRYYGNQKLFNFFKIPNYFLRWFITRDIPFQFQDGMLEHFPNAFRKRFHRATTENILILNGSDFTPPFDWNVELIRYWNEKFAKKTRIRIIFSSPERFIKAVKAERSQFPIVKGEILGVGPPSQGPNTFPGTYSSRPKIKKNVRDLERLLYNAELLATLVQEYGQEYPGKSLEEAWIWLLKCDFHDGICGCGIDPVYINVLKRLKMGQKIARHIMNRSLQVLEKNINTLQADADLAILVFNQLNWDRTSIVEFELPESFSDRFIIHDSDGNEVPWQIIEGTQPELKFIFLASSIPSVGYKIFYIKRTDELQKHDPVLKVHAEEGLFETNHIQLKLKDNKIESINDKDSDLILKAKDFAINELVWQNEKGDLYFHAVGDRNQVQYEGFELIENGALRTRLRLSGYFLKKQKPSTKSRTTFTQDIILYQHTKRIDFITHVENRLKNIRVQIHFPSTAEHTQFVTHIPYGFIERNPFAPRKNEKRWVDVRKGKFEYFDRIFPVQDWADISDGKKGYSLFNLSSPEYELGRSKELFLTLYRSVAEVANRNGPFPPGMILLKTPLSQEIGAASYRYAIYPHGGDFARENPQHRSREYSYPLIVQGVSLHDGKLPPKLTFLAVDSDSVLLTAFKEGEKGGITLRFLEIHGKNQKNVKFMFYKDIKSGFSTNLLENKPIQLKFQGSQLEFDLNPQEIKTIVINS